VCLPAASAAEKLQQGGAEAQYNLGWMYANGEGVPKDEMEAMKWYRKAADQGYAQAQYSLGVMYDSGFSAPKDLVEAVKWFRKAANQGHAGAQYNLGFLYDNGRGVPKDEAEAVKWYRKAADQGYAAAQNNLGNMYEPRSVQKTDLSGQPSSIEVEENCHVFASLLIIGCIELLIVAFYAAGNSAGPNGQAGSLSSDTGLFIACYSVAGFFLCALGLFWLLLDDNAAIKLREVKGALSVVLIVALIAPVMPIVLASPTPTRAETPTTQKADLPSPNSAQDAIAGQIQVSSPRELKKDSSSMGKSSPRGFSGWTSRSTGYDWNSAPEADKRHLCRSLERVSNGEFSAEFYYGGLNAMFDTTDAFILRSTLHDAVALLDAGGRAILR
jgi:hypothetical protein